MIKAKFNKAEKWYTFRSISEAEKYAESIGATRIKFEHDPAPLLKLQGEWFWLGVMPPPKINRGGY